MTRKYVVTGAASGIGKALTEQLRAEGHTVIGVDLRDADVTVDLTTTEGRAGLVEHVTELSGGTIDAVIAVAGLAAPIPATVGVNYFGAIATLEGLRPLLAGSDAPRAAVVASLAALEPTDGALRDALLAGDEAAALELAAAIADAPTDTPSNAIYNTSKNAIALWVRTNAPTADWAGAGIPLNAIAPGVIETPMIAEILATEEGRAALAAGAPAPLNGPAAPAAAPAALLAWLTSEQNTHVTGQVVFIDGGAEVLRRPEAV
jgi:NAD(P)-dependent dehydrogenase (short-subunit alcohol dehydrogenase family)